jgi:uncharacterized protein YggE
MIRSILIAVLVSLSACVVADDTPRTISVNGIGSAEATPDRAIVNMSIAVRHLSLTAAQDGASDVTAKVLAMTDGLKIDRSHIDTTGASIRPDYQFDRETQEQKLRGYLATRQIKLEIRDLDDMAKVVEGAIAAGVNHVSDPQLISSKSREAYRRSLSNAAADARANAEELAKALGMKLGPALQINVGSNAIPSPYQPQMRGAAMAMESDATETYNAGDLSMQTTISVVFELIE